MPRISGSVLLLVAVCGEPATAGVQGARDGAQERASPPVTRIGICTIIEPDAPDGASRRWAGSCRGTLGDGPGAGPMRLNHEEGVFAGRASNGRPVSGVLTLPDGAFALLAPEDPHPPEGMDAAAMASERAFKDAFAGATAASRAYRAAGNAASARYYARVREHLVSGQPE